MVRIIAHRRPQQLPENLVAPCGQLQVIVVFVILAPNDRKLNKLKHVGERVEKHIDTPATGSVNQVVAPLRIQIAGSGLPQQPRRPTCESQIVANVLKAYPDCRVVIVLAIKRDAAQANDANGPGEDRFRNPLRIDSL